MESLGEKLRTAREEKGLTMDQVSRETNISLRFIEALEIENFSIFPGETYITGFLKNYSARLDLDVQKMLSLYRAMKIQEQPVPVEQLLKPESKLPFILIVAAVVLVVLGAVGGIAYYLLFNRTSKPAAVVPASRAPAEYVMENNSLERRVYKGDSILVPVDSKMYKLEVANLGEAVTIRTPEGSVILDLSQEASIDLSNDGVHDLRITVADFAKNNADMGVLLHLSLLDTAAVYENIPDADPAFVETIAVAAAASNTVIIPSTPNAYPFTLQLNFQGFCMFRWEILNERDRRDRNERYFQRSDELNIQAQNGIRIWASNAQAAKFQVIGGGRVFPVEFGLSGEVVVADIRWVRGEDNQFRLVFVRLER